MSSEIAFATLSSAQIETLQHLIRQFKALGKRFSDSSVPTLIDSYSQSGVSVAPAQLSTTAVSYTQNPHQLVSQSQASGSQSKIVVKTDSIKSAEHKDLAGGRNVSQVSNKLHSVQSQSVEGKFQTASSAGSASVAPSSLSWQCYHSLLSAGAVKMQTDASSSLFPSDMGCFSKGAHLPLVPTLPLVAATLCGPILTGSLDLHSLQYAMRAAMTAGIGSGNKSLIQSNLSGQIEDYISYRSFYRVKKVIKRDSKAFEKDEKRKRTELEERRRKKLGEFHKSLLDFREHFFRYHKQKRADGAKVIRATKLWVENYELKKDKEEARAEIRRLQALKENDMEAYTSLVQETKNGRLKFLLSETDNYIATINRMIQEQRVEPGPGSEKLDSGKEYMDLGNAKNYYNSTHRLSEQVSQPLMLKGGDLKEYQLSGLQWLVSLYNNNLNGILADEMGLGKTIQTIALLSYIMEMKSNNGPFLIVVPLSTLSNWVNEFNKWAPDISKVVYKGNPEERKKIFKEEVESGRLNVLLTTYEYIMKDKASLKKLVWQYIIVDEGHRMKNAQSKFAMTLGSSYQSKHRILLTGTPLQNNLPELWALLNFLLPTIFSSVETFDQWFNKPFAAFRNQTASPDEAGELNVLTQEERMLIVHRLHEVLRPFMLRRVKDQVLDQLPDKVEKVLRCSLSGWQRKMYYSIAMKGIQVGKEKESGETGGLNNTIMQLRKVCNHPYLFIKDYRVDEDLIRVSGKFELLDRMLPKLRIAGHRVLIFSQMVEVINFLEDFFVYRGYSFLRLDGSTSSEEREKRMYAFNDPDSPYFVFLLSTRAGGLGLNLASADTVIIFDSDWNPMMDAQAQDRAHRIGQKNEVRVFRLLTNSVIEERILARANDKRNLTGLVVEAGKFSSRASTNIEDSREMMEALLREYSNGGLDVETASTMEDFDTPGADADAPDEDQLNEMMACYEGELELYQIIDKKRSVGQTVGRKAALMAANELPAWLREENWPTKYRNLMLSMMNTAHNKSSQKKLLGKSENNSDVASFLDEDILDQEGITSTDLCPSNSLRKRKEVVYDDGLTELQFQRLIEREQDAVDSRLRITKVAKKNDISEVCGELLKAVQDIQKIKTREGHLLCQLFLDKPSKDFYPDYYSIVKQPISLKDIAQRLRKGQYSFFEQIELDFVLMSLNARTYNSDQSIVFGYSETIRKEFYHKASGILMSYDIVDRPVDVMELPSSTDLRDLRSDGILKTPLLDGHYSARKVVTNKVKKSRKE